jgi:hypothetical protein
VALVVLFFIIRNELPKIAGSLRKVKYKDVELEFGEAIKAIATEVKDSVPQTQPSNIAGKSTEEIKTRLDTVASIAPRAAILEAWIQVEAAAADVINKKGLGSKTRYVGPSRLRDNLQKENILNDKQVHIFEQLRHLRNEAVHVHDAEFTQAAVASYIESAVVIASYLEGLANDL